MDILFKETDEFKTIYLHDNGSISIGSIGCTKITVSMEYGNGSGLAWFVIWSGDKIIQKFNSLHIEGVVYV